MRNLGTLILLVLASAGAAAGQKSHSVYTPLDEKHCRQTDMSTLETGDYEARCRGVAGYTLIVAEGDLRQNITVVTPGGAEHSLQLYELISSGFSTVGPKAEWRMTLKGKKFVPVALIVRFNASDDPNNPDKHTSYLAVSKIAADEICVTDKILPGPKANEEARRAADVAVSKPCLKR